MRASGVSDCSEPKSPPRSFPRRPSPRKHGGAKRRLWRKIHIGVDERTAEIRAIEITGSRIGDASMLPELLDQISADVGIGSVTADGAYDTRKCHEPVADRGADAFVGARFRRTLAWSSSLPPRKNAKPWKPSTAGDRPKRGAT